MKVTKWIIRSILIVLSAPVLYLLVSVVLSFIPIKNRRACEQDRQIYLSTNGVHADVIIPIKDLSQALKRDLPVDENDGYVAFGWGDRNFYLNTPEWSDLTFSTAVNAAFLKSETLMHVTVYTNSYKRWVKVSVCREEQNALMNYLQQSFRMASSSKILIDANSYGPNDFFYEAKGSYNCFYTCNTWLNSGLKDAGLKAALWTPFDFGILRHYED